MINVNTWTRVLVVVSVLALQACASVPARNPVPEALTQNAIVPGIPFGRFSGDELGVDADARVELLKSQILSAGDPNALAKPVSMLTISGGGADGAFGAGLLKGWTESGKRPEFLLVTGISTGALIAPLAFLGADYDDELERLYTSLSTSDLVKRRSILTVLSRDALADATPLRELMNEVYDQQLIERVAAQHKLGRRLLVGTTNLDTQRPVVWNLGEIALEGSDGSRQLIRDIILASASIPGAFPPVRVQVAAGGQQYDELHVDGGVSSQVFLYPTAVNSRVIADRVGLTGKQTVYVIRNGRLTSKRSVVEPELRPILIASLESVIRAQGIGDLYRIYFSTKRDGMAYRLAYIPNEFDSESEEFFDANYMRTLFDRAREMARDGYPWSESPPGGGATVKPANGQLAGVWNRCGYHPRGRSLRLEKCH